jgi:hypothetical protein
MATVSSVPAAKPDLVAHKESLITPFPKIVSRLVAVIGKKLTAYIASAKDTRTVDRWVTEDTSPYGDVVERLRFAFQVVRTLEEHDSPKVIQAWLTGVNPHLGDRVPIRVLREGDLGISGAEVLGAVRSFIVGA